MLPDLCQRYSRPHRDFFRIVNSILQVFDFCIRVREDKIRQVSVTLPVSGSVITGNRFRHDGDLIFSDQCITDVPVVIAPARFRRDERYPVAEQSLGIPDIERFRQTFRRDLTYVRRNGQFIQDLRDMASRFLLSGKVPPQAFFGLSVSGFHRPGKMHRPVNRIVPGPLRQPAAMQHIDAVSDRIFAQRYPVFNKCSDDIESADTVSVDVDERGDIDTSIYERLKGGTAQKSAVIDSRYVPRYRNGLQPGTTAKSTTTDFGHTVRYCDRLKTGTGVKSAVIDFCYPVRYYDGLKTGAFFKSGLTDFCYGIRYRD